MSKRLQVITRCYFPPDYVETAAGKMMSTARRIGLEPKPFGIGETQSTHGGSGEGPGAIQALQESDAEYVLCCDCADVAFLATQEEIMEKFLSFRMDFVVSTERCALRLMEPTSKVLNRFPGYQKEVNVGLWIGKRTHAIDVIQYAIDHYRYHDDTHGQDTLQTWLPLMYVSGNGPEFELDRNCVLFQSMAGVAPGVVNYDPNTHRVTNGVTGTAPCAIHFNGDKSLVAYTEFVGELMK